MAKMMYQQKLTILNKLAKINSINYFLELLEKKEKSLI